MLAAMTATALASVPDVCDVELVDGREASPSAPPDLLLEVPHGATRTEHFRAVASRLRGPMPEGLADFFHVNTDVGAPEVARRIAQRVVEARPARRAVVVRCRVPRTFVDCNRVIDPAAAARPSKPGEMTPGLMPWVTHEEDRRLLLGRYAAYRTLVEAAVEATCGRGGTAVFAHSYAPREVDVAVDEHVVTSLREAYRPENIVRFPLRPEVDLIARDPEGRWLVDEDLVARTKDGLARAGLHCAVHGAYPLHPSSMAWLHASRHRGRTICFEVRRDLVARAFTPFAEMEIDPAKADRVAAPLADALLAWWDART
jgi:hypothetical protein